MASNFSVQTGERVIVAATPDSIAQINWARERYGKQTHPAVTAFEAKCEYVRQLLTPYRWLQYPADDINFERHASLLDNAECFYSQENTLGAYGMNELVNYSQSSWPWERAIHQYKPASFTPDEVVGDMLSELNSGTWASSESSTLLMMMVGEDSFRNQVLSLLNAYRQEKPITPEVRGLGQVHVLRLGFKSDIDAIMEKMGKPNTYEGSDPIIDPILEIEAKKDAQTIPLEMLLPGINLWQMHDVRYAAHYWNEAHAGIAVMSVDMDYTHPENTTLRVSKAA